MSIPRTQVFETLLTTSEVAEILKVTPATVRNMIKRGDITDCIQLNKGGRILYRVPMNSLRSLMGNDLPANESRSVFSNL